jgi:predicted DNA-binding transcriptional regulator AlpA
MTASPKELATLTGQKTDSIYKKIQRGQYDDLPKFIRLSGGPKSKIIFLDVPTWLEKRAEMARARARVKKREGGAL